MSVWEDVKHADFITVWCMHGPKLDSPETASVYSIASMVL